MLTALNMLAEEELRRLYIPIKVAVADAQTALTDASCKSLLITGSPGVGKSLLATDLARQLLPGGALLTEATPATQSISKEAFPDGVLWVDLRNKLDETGLLARERLHDILTDLTPPGSEASAPPETDDGKLQQQVADRLSGRRFCLFVDNVHAQDADSVETFCRITAKHSGKLVITSSRAQIGPAMSGSRVVNLTTDIVKESGVALKLLLAEAGLVLPESPDHEITLGIDPGLLDFAKRIIVGAGYCLGAVALIGSKRKQSPTDLQGWRGALQGIEALTQGISLQRALPQADLTDFIINVPHPKPVNDSDIAA